MFINLLLDYVKPDYNLNELHFGEMDGTYLRKHKTILLLLNLQKLLPFWEKIFHATTV